jgi:hypothetical protein
MAGMGDRGSRPKKIFIKRFGIDPVPGLPDFYEPGGLWLEDLEINREIQVRIIDPPVAHPLRKGLCFIDQNLRFFPADQSWFTKVSRLFLQCSGLPGCC